MNIDINNEGSNYWEDFRVILKERICKPCNHPTFVMYFFVIVVIIGSLGLLEPLIGYFVFDPNAQNFPRSLISAACTYFIAIAATAAVDFILSIPTRKHLLMFFVLCSIAVFACFVVAVVYGSFLRRPLIAFIPATVGYLISLFLWWIGNADNAHLLDTIPKATAPMGNDMGPAGSLDGFKA